MSLLISAPFVTSCQSVSPEEKAEVIGRIVGHESSPEEVTRTPAETAMATAAMIAAMTAEAPTASVEAPTGAAEVPTAAAEAPTAAAEVPTAAAEAPTAAAEVPTAAAEAPTAAAEVPTAAAEAPTAAAEVPTAAAEAPTAAAEAPTGAAAAPTAAAAAPTPAIEPRPRQKPKMPLRQNIARLPLPRGVAHSDLLQFVNVHADVLVPYQPMQREWNYYSQSFAVRASAGELELESMRLRIGQDFPRAHWLFVWGLHQTSLLLLNQTGRPVFLIDRQEDFLGRISVLLFLSGELDALTRRSEYRDVLRKFYKHANEKYFKRKLSDRPEKPEGLLRPPQNPKVPVTSEEQD